MKSTVSSRVEIMKNYTIFCNNGDAIVVEAKSMESAASKYGVNKIDFVASGNRLGLYKFDYKLELWSRVYKPVKL